MTAGDYGSPADIALVESGRGGNGLKGRAGTVQSVCGSVNEGGIFAAYDRSVIGEIIVQVVGGSGSRGKKRICFNVQNNYRAGVGVLALFVVGGLIIEPYYMVFQYLLNLSLVIHIQR